MASFHYFSYMIEYDISLMCTGPYGWIGFRSPSYGHSKQIFAKFENFLWALLIWRGVLKGGRGVRRHLQIFLNSCWSGGVGRVLSFFSNRQNWDSPNPSPAGECALPLWIRGEGHTRWRERGWESPNSDEGTLTVVFFIYVLCAVGPLWAEVSPMIYSK